MKFSRLFFNIIGLTLILIGLASSMVCARDYPEPKGYVNDFADILSYEVETSLEAQLSTLEKDTTSEVVFVCVETIGDSTLEEYAVGLFEKWGIGKKDRDNGVLFLVSLAEGDIRIEVGYGLEHIITDGRAGRILDEFVVPYFADGDFDQGIESGLSAIEGYIRADTSPSVVEENPVRKALANFHLPTPFLITLGVITIYMVGFMARTRSIWLGGVWGIILGIILGFGFGSLLYIILLPIGLGIMGLVLDAILSTNYRGRSAGGLPTGWIPSGGGFKGSSGGFGGFGGGRSGGGGAGRHF